MSKKQHYTEAKLAKLLDGASGPEELYDLGTQIRQQTDSSNNYNQAMMCFERAANMGYAPAQNDLGTMFREGYGCESDIPEAIKWYEKAAEQGEVIAYYNLATIYLHGVVGPQNYPLAAEYLHQAVELGSVDAASDFGTMYRFGHGVDQDFVKAAELHFQAATNGDYVAMANLCDYYHELFAPAMNGSLVASRVLHLIYKKGYGDESDPAVAWAWIRWAYDVCLPLSSTAFLDPLQSQVFHDFHDTWTSTDPAARDNGDKYLFRVMTECESKIQPSWQPILIFGGELGFIRILGRWWMDGWEFLQDSYDDSLSLIDDKASPCGDVSDLKWRWTEAIELIDRYPLHQLHPVYAHPEFGDRIFKLVFEKAAAANSEMASEELWMEICRQK